MVYKVRLQKGINEMKSDLARGERAHGGFLGPTVNEMAAMSATYFIHLFLCQITVGTVSEWPTQN